MRHASIAARKGSEVMTGRSRAYGRVSATTSLPTAFRASAQVRVHAQIRHGDEDAAGPTEGLTGMCRKEVVHHKDVAALPGDRDRLVPVELTDELHHLVLDGTAVTVEGVAGHALCPVL